MCASVQMLPEIAFVHFFEMNKKIIYFFDKKFICLNHSTLNLIHSYLSLTLTSKYLCWSIDKYNYKLQTIIVLFNIGVITIYISLSITDQS